MTWGAQQNTFVQLWFYYRVKVAFHHLVTDIEVL
jgi:hypothetical protein